MNTAWQLVREEGTEALTLGRLAERSGVTKPVVYDHFIHPFMVGRSSDTFDATSARKSVGRLP